MAVSLRPELECDMVCSILRATPGMHLLLTLLKVHVKAGVDWDASLDRPVGSGGSKRPVDFSTFNERLRRNVGGCFKPPSTMHLICYRSGENRSLDPNLGRRRIFSALPVAPGTSIADVC